MIESQDMAILLTLSIIMQARAVLVDMECGVVNNLMSGPIGELFDSRQTITDVSGAGNNWAHGNAVYGPQYREAITESVRRTVEFCDSLQSFFLLHSLGGGTGSGLGSYVMQLLSDEFQDVYRFSAPIIPSAQDDVVTSPYNSILTLNALTEYADCVIPMENQALFDITTKIAEAKGAKKGTAVTDVTLPGGKTPMPWDQMNQIAAHVLGNLTSGMRFEGSLNVDLNEITMNLVPFPRLHFLIPSLAPLCSFSDVNFEPRSLDQMFNDCFHRDFQLIKANPRASKYLAIGLLVRGDVHIAEANRNINRLQKDVDMIHWNQEGFKVGLCGTPPPGQKHAILGLSNNTCFKETLGAIHGRFNKLYRRKAHLHHYTEFIEESDVTDASEGISSLIEEYSALEGAVPPEEGPERFRPAF